MSAQVRWEHVATTLSTDMGHAAERLDAYGALGWELVSVVLVNGVPHAFLKRRIDQVER